MGKKNINQERAVEDYSSILKAIPVIGLGQNGEGIVDLDGKQEFIPFVLPGDQVDLQFKNKKWQVLRIYPLADRKAPDCIHFTECGGCSLQHFPLDFYENFKINRIKGLLKRERAEPLAYNPLVQIPPHTRRRSNFKVQKTHKNLILGFHHRRSHTVLPITMCSLLVPALAELIDPLKSLCSLLLPVGGLADIFLLETKAGIDMSLDSCWLQKFYLSQLEHLSLFCQERKIARLRINDDLVVQHRQPVIEFSGVAVEVDAKSFCQVSELSDRCLVEIVESYLMKISSISPPNFCEKTADLFCGRGAFTFLLAKRGAVDAYELEEESLVALNRANQQLKLKIKTQKRNLFSSPLTSQELDKYSIILIDPPRAGALSQCHEISKSTCQSVIYVSCNPITFARDAHVLKEGGYILTSLTPFDQFLWTEHVEVVGLFSREKQG